MMIRGLIVYLAGLVSLCMLDGLWLGVVIRGFTQREIGALMREKIAVAPTAMFYVLYPVGVYWLSVQPASATLSGVALRSAALGLMVYGTFDLTCLAILRGYSLRFALVDVAWGAVVTAAVGVAMHLALTRM